MTALRILLACVLVTGAWLLAQAPVNDQVKVEFTTPVIVGDKIMAPGKYEIRRLPTANNPLIFEFVSADGIRTEATASAAPLVDNLARHPTSVVLTQNGNNTYVSRLWIAGETYGYEFSPPSGDNIAIAERSQTSETRLTATYTPDPPPVSQVDIAARQREEEERLRLERERAELLERQRLEESRRAAAQPAPQPAPEPTLMAQARPPETPAKEPATPPAGGAQEMPRTADGWPTMMIAGLSLIGFGVLTRRIAR